MANASPDALADAVADALPHVRADALANASADGADTFSNALSDTSTDEDLGQRLSDAGADHVAHGRECQSYAGNAIYLAGPRQPREDAEQI